MAVKRILALWIIALNCILFAQRGSSWIFCNFKAYFMHKILMRRITFLDKKSQLSLHKL